MAYSRLTELLDKLIELKESSRHTALSETQVLPSLSQLSLIGFPSNLVGLEDAIVFITGVLTGLVSIQSSATGQNTKRLGAYSPQLLAQGISSGLLPPLVAYIDSPATCDLDQEREEYLEVIDPVHTDERSIFINSDYHYPSLAPVHGTFSEVFVSRTESTVYGDLDEKVRRWGSSYVIATTNPRSNLLQFPPGFTEVVIFAPDFMSTAGVKTANPWLPGAIEIAIDGGVTISVTSPSVYTVDAPTGAMLSFASASPAVAIIKCVAHDDGNTRFAGTAVSVVKAVELGLDIAVGIHARFEKDVMMMSDAVLIALNASFADGLNSFNRSHLSTLSKLGIWAYGPRDNVGFLNALLSVKTTRLSLFKVVYNALDYKRV